MSTGELSLSEWENYANEWYSRGGREILNRITEWYETTYNIN